MDPVRISQSVKKNMLQANSMYQKPDEKVSETMDVNLVSKDMELNFSSKNEDEDELDTKMQVSDKESIKQELMDEGNEDEKEEKLQYDEEQKDFQIKKQDIKSNVGRPNRKDETATELTTLVK